MREAYDAIAPEYARHNADMREVLKGWGERFLAIVGTESRILDLGCGAGRDMAWLEARGAMLVGADLSAGMLAQVGYIVRGPLLQADMRRLPLAAGSFDGVWCMASLLHLPKNDAPVAVGEMRRVLRPGGPLLLGLHEGEGEVWEPSPYGSVERFFARYSLVEAEALVASCGFTIEASNRNTDGPRPWLQLLARKPNSEA